MEKEIKRQIQLLALLTSEKRWFRSTEITDILGCSHKTIMKDISLIKEFLPFDCKIQAKKGRGIRLYMSLNMSSEEISSLLFRKSLTFQVLHQLFEGKVQTIVSLAENLYVQVAAISPTLKRIERYLKHFDLRLQRKPLKIVGDQVQIIVMFYDLYLKSYMDSEWPFLEYKQEKIFQLLESLEALLGISLHISFKSHLSYLIAIWLKRKQQGYEMNLENKFLYHNIETLFFKKISKIGKQLEREYNIYLTIQDKILLTTAIKCSKYIYTDLPKEKAENILLFNQGTISVYKLVREFIYMLEEKLLEKLMHNEEFTFALIEYFRRTIYRLRCLSTLEFSQKSTTYYIIDNHFETFLKVKEVYIKWAQKYDIADCVPDDEIAKVTMYIEAMHFCRNLTCKKALLIIGESESWTEYLMVMLTNKFGGKLQISTEFPVDYSYEKGTDMEIDFIISTIPFHHCVIPVVHIQAIPTERDFDNIQLQIEL
ncbi:helix-turn-helix domain-containing protein [Bacillus fungorum]|uniref:BglG family transcription antiterminator n=1 Tax=Bacillus fungorum TaxID=2039284 RepID=UPI003395683A